MIVIITYAATFFAQVDEKIKTQMTLEKLELAHRQVKQLTLQNERQKNVAAYVIITIMMGAAITMKRSR